MHLRLPPLLALLTVASLCTHCGPALNHPGPPEPEGTYTGGPEIPFVESLLSLGEGEEAVESRIWNAPPHPSKKAGVIFVSGVDGGFIEPVDGIYERIARKLSRIGVPSVFVKYRSPGELENSVADAVAGANYLRALGKTRLALVGWSFGGAVITQSAVRIPEAVTIVGLAPQARDTEAVTQFGRQSILLVHSRDDENVPFISSEQILSEAPAAIRRQLIALDGFDHYLSGARAQVDPFVENWLKAELGY
jgi:alpha/beta superfamily hydrolase